MLDTPDIATLARLIGDRARSSILMAMMTGRALTATELARGAAVSQGHGELALVEALSWRAHRGGGGGTASLLPPLEPRGGRRDRESDQPRAPAWLSARRFGPRGSRNAKSARVLRSSRRRPRRARARQPSSAGVRARRRKGAHPHRQGRALRRGIWRGPAGAHEPRAGRSASRASTGACVGRISRGARRRAPRALLRSALGQKGTDAR